MTRRDWSAAKEKIEDEGTCRVPGCGGNPIQAAHLWHRGMGGDMDADGIIPLCLTHHGLFDRHTFDVLGLLSLDEQVYVVRQAGSIERARQRLAPTEYQRT